MSTTPSQPQKDFFISYSAVDRPWAEWISWQLEEANKSVVLEAWDFRPGESRVLDLNQATKEAERIIILLSTAYLKDPDVETQWSAFFDLKGKNPRIIPIRIEKCDITGLLGPIIYIDFAASDEFDEEEARSLLLDGIDPKRAKPKSPPSFPKGKSIAAIQSNTQQILPAKPPNPSNISVIKTIDVFLVDAMQDAKQRENVIKSLTMLRREGYIKEWHQGNIIAGSVRKTEIQTHFDKAGLILLLLSPDFLYSDECYNLALRAVERSERGETRAVPIIIRPCTWEGTPLEHLQVLPRNHKPISQWTSIDEAYKEIANEIRTIVDELTTSKGPQTHS